MADTAMAETVLDQAHARMQAAPEDAAARLAFYEKLVGCELFVLLEGEAEGDQITPRLFEVDGASYVLGFDSEERLSGFAGGILPFVAMSGRAVCAMLAPAGLGLGLNLEVAPSSILLPPGAVGWIDGMDRAPEALEAQVEHFRAPGGLPEALIAALDARLAAAGGLADMAYLVGVSYAGGGIGHLLGFVDAPEPGQAALAQSVSQALAFSGLEAGALDVGFFAASDPAAAHLARHGLRFDLPKQEAAARPAPGSDPDKPPILR